MTTKIFSDLFESVGENLPSTKPLRFDRKDLPQFDAETLSRFVSFLRSKGIVVRDPEWINVGLIHFTQKKIDPDKIDDLMSTDQEEGRVYLLDREFHLVDGHHAIFAQKLVGEDLWARCYQAEIGIEDIIRLSNEFV